MKTLKFNNRQVKVTGEYAGLNMNSIRSALYTVERHKGSLREKDILQKVNEIYVERHKYPKDLYITGTVYDEEGNEFEMIIEYYDQGQFVGRRKGDITG